MNKQYLWLIFSLVFLALAIFHLLQSTRNIPKPENKAHAKSIAGVNLGIHEFINNFRNYIDNTNKQNRMMNLVNAFNYLLAFLTSLYSYYLS